MTTRARPTTWLRVLGALGALTLATSTQAAVFPVSDSSDAIDAVPGDGLCASPIGTCTLRAAFTTPAGERFEVRGVVDPACGIETGGTLR